MDQNDNELAGMVILVAMDLKKFKRKENSMLKNTLVQYQGGGYDGCFWEWNFYWLDANGKFHDIFSSGYKGIRSDEDVEDSDDFGKYEYNFEDQKDIDDFVSSNNEQNIVMVGKWLEEKFPEYSSKIIVECDSCGEHFPADTASHSGYHGNGGIGIVYTGFICPNCQEQSIESDSIEPVIVIMEKH